MSCHEISWFCKRFLFGKKFWPFMGPASKKRASLPLASRLDAAAGRPARASQLVTAGEQPPFTPLNPCQRQQNHILPSSTTLSITIPPNFPSPVSPVPLLETPPPSSLGCLGFDTSNGTNLAP